MNENLQKINAQTAHANYNKYIEEVLSKLSGILLVKLSELK